MHWYRSVYLDTESWNPDEDRFELTPMTSEAFGWELERTKLFERWDSARKSGAVMWNNGDDDSFGALPEDRSQYRELNDLMDTYLGETPPLHLARGNFGPTAGCVSMTKSAMLRLLARLGPNTKIVIG